MALCADDCPALGQHEPIGDAVTGEGRPQSVRPLREVRPTLEVHGHDGAGVEDLRRLGGTVARQRQIRTLEPMAKLNRTSEEHRDGHRPGALGNRAHNIHRGVVADT